MPMMFLADVLLVKAVELPTVIDKGDFCWCSYICKTTALVFAGDSDLNSDKSSFLFRRVDEGDSLTMTLWKEGEQVADLNNDDYGIFYDFGDLVNDLLSGYQLDWKAVYDAFGGGQFQVKASYTLLSQTFTFESILYNLMVYNELAAHKTVRIETWQNGFIESDPIDFSLVNWYSQYRIYGHFGNRQPAFETENYLDSDRNTLQIQDKITDTYTLNLPSLSMEEKDQIIYRELLANRIRITDYNVDNEDKYRQIEVYPSDIEKVTYRINRPGSSMVLKFKAKTDNNLKRNITF